MDGPVTATFAYDPFGRRVTKTIDGATTTYLYDEDSIAQQRDPDGGTATYLNGPAPDEVLARTSDDGMTHTNLTDVQGSVLGLAGPEGAIDTRYSYDPYGATTAHGVPDPNPFGYTGRELDETGLYYHRNRYYHPGQGRFMSEDPIGFTAGDTNLYAYARNDPVNHTDPDGLQAVGTGACFAAHAATLGYVMGNFDEATDLLDPDDYAPGDKQRLIALDRLHRRNMNALAAWQAICAFASVGSIPRLGGLAAANRIGSFGRGIPALARRAPAARPPPAFGAPGPRTARLPGRGACSFAGDTEVLMADGTTTPIGEVKVGDLVLATDPEAGEHGPREVTHTWVHGDTLLDLQLDGGETVTTTANHPFWNQTDATWQRADELDPGDHLLTPTGETVTVDGIDPTTARTDPAHHLTIEGTPTYYVLAHDTPILVHNQCRDVPWTTGSLPQAEERALQETLRHIDAGTTPTGPLARRWGTRFRNTEERLPGPFGDTSPYLEYRVAPPPGTQGAGPLRVVVDSRSGATYYTWTHYGDAGTPAFVRIR